MLWGHSCRYCNPTKRSHHAVACAQWSRTGTHVCVSATDASRVSGQLQAPHQESHQLAKGANLPASGSIQAQQALTRSFERFSNTAGVHMQLTGGTHCVMQAWCLQTMQIFESCLIHHTCGCMSVHQYQDQSEGLRAADEQVQNLTRATSWSPMRPESYSTGPRGSHHAEPAVAHPIFCAPSATPCAARTNRCPRTH